jgi:hypothetical protein
MCGHQLVVVAFDEIFPGEFRIPGLGSGGRQVEAQGIGVVLAEKVGHLQEGAAALAWLCPLKVEVLMVKRGKFLPS